MPAAAWCTAVHAAATHVVPPETDGRVIPDEQLIIAVLVDSTLVDEGDQAASGSE